MDLTIKLKVKKTIWFHLLMKLRVCFISMPLIKLYMDNKHIKNIYFKDIIDA